MALPCLSGLLGACLELVWGLPGASCGQSGPLQGPNPANLSVKICIRERLPHQKLIQQTVFDIFGPANHTVRSLPHPSHKGKRGGEAVDDPCPPLTHFVPLLPERERQEGGRMSPSRCPSSSDIRMDHVALPLPFPFWTEGERVSQWLAGIVDRFPSPLPFLERDGEDGGLVDGRLGSQNGMTGLGVPLPLPLANH